MGKEVSQIEITVSVDGALIDAAVRQAWSNLLASPERGSYQPEGYKAIRGQVLQHIVRMDLSEQIADIARAQMADVLVDVVRQVIASEGKKQAKALVRGGLLEGLEQ